MTEREIFIAALQRESPTERQAFLDEVCAARPGMRDQVRQAWRVLVLEAFRDGELQGPPGPPTMTYVVTAPPADSDKG